MAAITEAGARPGAWRNDAVLFRDRHRDDAAGAALCADESFVDPLTPRGGQSAPGKVLLDQSGERTGLDAMALTEQHPLGMGGVAQSSGEYGKLVPDQRQQAVAGPSARRQKAIR